MTKRCLKKIISKARLSYDELLTSPHLLTGRKLVTLLKISELQIYNDDEYYGQLDTREHFTKRVLYLIRILKNFWKKW